MKIVPPAQTPAPCDQRTARVRTTVDLCLDLLAKVLRSATVRSAILRERIGSALDPLRRSLRLASCEVHAAIGGTGLPAPRSASCERCSASCNRASAHAWPRCCELQSASCGLRLAHSSRIAARGLRLAGLQPDQAALSTPCAHACELRAVLCELQSCLSTCLASMLRAAICELRLATGPRIASCLARASQLAGCDPAARCQMVCCVPSLTNKYTPGCSHLLGRELSQVTPRRNCGLVTCNVLSCSRVLVIVRP